MGEAGGFVCGLHAGDGRDWRAAQLEFAADRGASGPGCEWSLYEWKPGYEFEAMLGARSSW